MTVTRTVYVNEAFRPQRVSGQQRYAREISDRLPDSFVRIAPTGFWASSKIATWLWVQTVLPLSTWRGVLISMTARAPIWHPRHLVVIHDLFVIEHPEWFSKKYHLTHAPLQRFQMATSRAIVAVSEPVAEQLRRPSRSSVEVAPNAPSDVFAESGPDDAASVIARGLTAGSYLVTVGSLEPRKNLVRLAEAYGRLTADQRQRVPLVVVGGSAGVYSQNDVTWPDGTVLAGYVSDDELRALYAGSAATVFVSLAEGFGLPIVEAAVAGSSRLVLSDIAVFRWIAGDEAIYADPESVDSIFEGLSRAASGEGSPPGAGVGRFSWSTSAGVVAEVALSAGRRGSER